MKKLKGFLLGLLMLFIAVVIEAHMRRKDGNATRGTALKKGEDGTTLGPPPPRHQLLSHLQEVAMRRSFMWYVNAALLIVVAALVTCCTPSLYTSVEMVEMYNYYGMSDCDMNGNPIVKIRKDTANYPYRYTLIHEHTHAGRMRKYGCVKFMQRYRSDTAFAFNEEATAYCAEARAMMANGVRAKIALEYAAARTQNHPKGQHLPLAKAREKLPCRGLQDVPSDTVRPP